MQVTHKNGIEDKEENSFNLLLQKYIPYWWLFGLLVIICGFGAWIYLHLATPIYETSATIMVKDEKKGVDDQNLMEQLDLFGSKKLVENEIEVIKSRMLMRKVVCSLYLYAPVTAKHRFKEVSAYTSSPVLIEAKDSDHIVLEKKVFFTYDSARNQVIMNNDIYPMNKWFNDSLNVIRFVKNPNYYRPEEVYPLFYSMIPTHVVIDNFLEALKVTQATKLASVINLALRDDAPQRGEDVLNGLIKAYNYAAIEDKNVQADNTLRFINERLSKMIGEIDSVELGVQEYKTKEGIIDLSAQGQLYLDNVGVNDQKLSEVNVQLAVMDQIEKYVRSKNNQPGIVPSTFGVDDPVLTALLGKLYDLEVQYEGLRKTTAENNPLLESIRDEIEKIKPNILENVHSMRRNLEAGKANLSGTSSKYASILKKIPQKEKGLVQISRRQTIMNSTYSFLLQKREETALSYNSAVADTRIVDYAQSGARPVSPKRPVAYLIAIILGCALGAAYVTTKEAFNQNIVFRDEIEQATMVPIIGELMQENSADVLVIGEGKRTVIAEQFRHLRTSLAYIGVGIHNRKKTTLITSNVSGEGKSFVAANLAVSLALTNKKVVLLEMDLRKPNLSHLFGISREVGLVNYLIGDKDADHIIKSTTISPNLFLIPSGAVPPNPSELIANGRLRELLGYLNTLFDYILIDSAPVGPVTDSYVISPLCDATLFVIRHGVSPKALVKILDRNIATHNLSNVAIIFNGVKSRGLGKYGYGYGQGYTGSYAYDDKKQSLGRRILDRLKS